MKYKSLSILLVLLMLFPGIGDCSETSDLEKATQNPIANSIGFEVQNTMLLGVGPNNDFDNITMFQPVIPHRVGEWNIIHRPMLPLTYLSPVEERTDIATSGGYLGNSTSLDSAFGLGDLTYQLFFSPANSDKIIWGVGPATRFPTHTDPQLGTRKYSAGVNAVALTQPGNWTLGCLAMNIWSYAGASSAKDVNEFTLQPFINYSLGDGWALATSPVMNANWNAPNSDRWTIPVGGGFNKLFTDLNAPLLFKLRVYYNAVRPDGAADWQIVLSVQPIFPTQKAK